jgi:hypothetical protein
MRNGPAKVHHASPLVPFASLDTALRALRAARSKTNRPRAAPRTVVEAIADLSSAVAHFHPTVRKRTERSGDHSSRRHGDGKDTRDRQLPA